MKVYLTNIIHKKGFKSFIITFTVNLIDFIVNLKVLIKKEIKGVKKESDNKLTNKRENIFSLKKRV